MWYLRPLRSMSLNSFNARRTISAVAKLCSSNASKAVLGARVEAQISPRLGKVTDVFSWAAFGTQNFQNGDISELLQQDILKK